MYLKFLSVTKVLMKIFSDQEFSRPMAFLAASFGVSFVDVIDFTLRWLALTLAIIYTTVKLFKAFKQKD